MDFIDLFAGIGGMRLGLEKAGMRCVGYVEKDKHARNSYESMYDTDGEWTAWDITEVEADDIPKADLWAFGFPCQDISVAGERKGLKGERSGLFYQVIKLVKSKSTEDRPRWLLCENVKNLLSIDGGGGFTEVLCEMAEAGYDVEWHLINSKDYGVPQNRERVFIIGRLRDGSGRQVLPISRESEQIDRETQFTQQTCERQEVSERQVKYGDRFDHMIGNRKYQNSHVYGVGGVSRACDTKQEIYYAIPKDRKIQTYLRGNHQHEVVYGIDGIGRTLTSAEGGGLGGGVRTGLYAIPVESELKQIVDGDQASRVYDSEGLSKTITGCAGGGGAKTGYYAVPKNDTISGIQRIIDGDHETDNVVSCEGISKSLKATDYKNPHKVAIPKVEAMVPAKHSHNLVLKEDSLSRALKVGDGIQKVAVPKIDPMIQNKHSQDLVLKEESLSRAVAARDYKGAQTVAIPTIKTVHKSSHQKGDIVGTDGLCRTLTATDYKEPQRVAIPCLTPDRENKRQNGRRFKENGDPMFTLTTQDIHGILIYDGKEYYVRRLTPKECFRLQGFDDERFEKAQAVNSNTQLYKQAGNAVTVNVAEFLGNIIGKVDNYA